MERRTKLESTTKRTALVRPTAEEGSEVPGAESVSLSARGAGLGVLHHACCPREGPTTGIHAKASERTSKDTEIEGEGYLAADPAGSRSRKGTWSRAFLGCRSSTPGDELREPKGSNV